MQVAPAVGGDADLDASGGTAITRGACGQRVPGIGTSLGNGIANVGRVKRAVGVVLVLGQEREGGKIGAQPGGGEGNGRSAGLELARVDAEIDDWGLCEFG